MRTPRILFAALAVLGLAVACSVPPPGAGDATTQDLHRISTTPVAATYHPPAKCKGYIALSFDDGPTDDSISLVQTLQANKIPATFFNTGEHTKDSPEAIAAEKAMPGAQFGNHSWDHPDLSTLPRDQVVKQIADTQAAQGKGVTFFRPPFGSANTTVLDVMKQLGVLEVLWTKDAKDFDATSVSQIVAQSMGMGSGGILLLHDGHPMTIEAVPMIANAYAKLGLCIGKIAPSAEPTAPLESPALTYYAKAVAP